MEAADGQWRISFKRASNIGPINDQSANHFVTSS
jgi:hypothetical protein